MSPVQTHLIHSLIIHNNPKQQCTLYYDAGNLELQSCEVLRHLSEYYFLLTLIVPLIQSIVCFERCILMNIGNLLRNKN